MVRGDPTYEERLAQVESFLASKHAIVLATTQGDRVTARTVSFASRGVEIYFMSYAENKKCRQIRANPHVGLCRDHVQIEGTAEILGPVSGKENAEIAGILRAKYPEVYSKHAAHPEMFLVRVRPSTIGVFRNEGDEFVVDHLDMERKALTVERLAGS
jgi:general stress protein 26